MQQLSPVNTIKQQLNKRISHTEQREIVSEVESIKKEHEIALKVCNEILATMKKKVTKIEVE